MPWHQLNYPTQIHVGAYIDGDFSDFNKLTADMMLTLKKEASQKNARGGHVFFSHFHRDGKDYLLVAIINDTLGAALTDDLDVTDVKHLDMDGFRFAGRINMTGWSEGEDRYISFLMGKGDIAEYFKEFLGCDTSVAERYDTQTLVKALGLRSVMMPSQCQRHGRYSSVSNADLNWFGMRADLGC
ncbi:nucleoid-associated protein [Rhizobium redzepovicii]|uniref:Nucleoid-associated protein n=1 Tax=Rhizobium redzepovicii TaxID=2867518 RepID=A0AAW8PAS9_9HYPH|nr:nucleoid-associated protein [Rhizobium redzepovicii]MDR9764141.1 nucleoid-associated protein [Rhizobium redzepovicii]